MRDMSSAQLERLARKQDLAGLEKQADHTLALASERRQREDDMMLSIPRHERDGAPRFVGRREYPTEPPRGSWAFAQTLGLGDQIDIHDELWAVDSITRYADAITVHLERGDHDRVETFADKALLWIVRAA